MGTHRKISRRSCARSQCGRLTAHGKARYSALRQLRYEFLEDRVLLAADLIADGISVSDTTVDPGQSVNVRWTARNVGDSATGIFPLGTSQQGVMWSTDSTIRRSDTLLEREFLGWLSDGSSTTELHTVSIPDDAVPGQSYWIGVIADYDRDISESNENNNADGAPSKVTINQADLVVNDIEMDGQTSLPDVRSGDSVRLDFEVENRGTATTIRDVSMRWYWGATEDSTENFIAAGSLGTINGLAPGEIESETDASWTIPPLFPGEYWLTGVIDWDGRVAESSESNNTRSESFTVLPGRLSWRDAATSEADFVTNIDAGQTVWAHVEGDPGESFVIEIWEDDGELGDDLIFSYSTTIGPAGYAANQWTVPWQADDGNDPQNSLYLFYDAIGPNNSTSFLLDVTVGAAERVNRFALPLTFDWGPAGPVEGVVDVELRRREKDVDGNPPLVIDPNAQQTWVVIHGRGSNSDNFANFADDVLAATNQEHQVLLLDWRDGASIVPGGSLTDFSGEAWIRPVAQLVSQLLANTGFQADRLNLIGHSWGGVVAGELAAAFADSMGQRGVNGLVALDPAEDAPVPFGTSYSTNDVVFGGDNSNYSWSFYTPGVAGNEGTPTTADEAFVVLDSTHSNVADFFRNMITAAVGTVSRFFDLERLLAHAAGPWAPNRYDPNGVLDPQGGYEAVIDTTDNGTRPVNITFTENDGFPTPRPGDYDQDGDSDSADFLAWQRRFGMAGADLPADGNFTESVDRGDLDVWLANYGLTIPPALGSATQAVELAGREVNARRFAGLAVALDLFDGNEINEIKDIDENEIDAIDAVFESRLFAGQFPIQATRNSRTSEMAPRAADKEPTAAVSKQNDATVEQAWLTDELLEPVFG